MDTQIRNDEEFLFEERADFLEIKDLIAWNVETDHSKLVQSDLISKGAKLLVGPRGTGKTHQMRYVYQQCVDNKSYPLAIYVTFGKYYHLEPFLVKESNAIQIFHSWVLAKIILGLSCALNDCIGEFTLAEHIELEEEQLKKFIGEIEFGHKSIWHDEVMVAINCESTVALLEKMAVFLNRKRVVLLLDDAALTLTPDYLVEFFDIFRSLKTIKIAPKASVYPGSTQYGPRFHVGHDAQKVNMWFNVEESDYLDFMRSMVSNRFPEIESNNLIPREIINLFVYCAFGIPRALIKLMGDYCRTNEGTQQSKFNRVLQRHVEDIQNEYVSLKQKLPQYQTIVMTGWDLIDAVFARLTEENIELYGKNEKQLVLGIQQEPRRNIMAERMISFLVEAGLLFPLTPVKHGKDRTYDRYIPHLAFLVSRRAFSGKSRGFSSSEILGFLNRDSVKHPSRARLNTLLDFDFEQLKLDLPPCSSCATMRLTEEQRFCHNCGAQLVNKSSFEHCMQISINDLPLSKWRKDKIINEVGIKVLGDIVSSENPAKELQKARYMGPVRANQTFSIVLSFVEEFLA